MKSIFPANHICNRSVAKIIEIQKPLNKFHGLHLLQFGCYFKEDNTGYLFYTNKPFFTIRMALNIAFPATYMDDNIHPWSELHSESYIKIAEDFNIYNAVNFLQRAGSGHEGFTFAFSDKKNPGISFYLTHMDMLKKFIEYFKSQAKDLIDEAEQTRVKIPDYLLGTEFDKHTNAYEEDIKLLLMNMSIPEDLTEKNNPLKTLTKREFLCLCYYLMGKTADEISKILNLSQKTVSTHLYNTRAKLACKNRSELFKKAWSLGLLHSKVIDFSDVAK